MTEFRTLVVDGNRLTNLGPVTSSLGGQADYAAAIVVDESGAEQPMLVRIDAIDNNHRIKVRPMPDVEHEQLGELPLDYRESIWIDSPATQAWRLERQRRAR